MYSTTNDLAQLLHLIFRDDVPYMQQPNQILDALSIREWMLPRFVSIQNYSNCVKSLWTFLYNDLTGWGLSWEILAAPILYTKVCNI